MLNMGENNLKKVYVLQCFFLTMSVRHIKAIKLHSYTSFECHNYKTTTIGKDS